MITVNAVYPALFLQCFKPAVDILMTLLNAGKMPVFPQFFPVTEFKIGETMRDLVVYRRHIQMLVSLEIIICPSLSPVAVADDDLTAASVKRKMDCF